MHRIIWIGGVACVAQVACIEDRTPSADSDAGVPDAAGEPEPGPEPREAEPIEPEPLPTEPEPAPNEPEPDPEVPPWICPPEGRFIFSVGACVSEAGGPPSMGRFEARITEIGEGLPADGACGGRDDFPPTVIGRIGDSARWFNAVTPDGRVWQIVLDLPVEVRFEAGEAIVIDAQLREVGFLGYGGNLAISTAEGLQAFVQAGAPGGPSLADPELILGRGAQTCYSEDDEDAFCTYTGYRLRAGDPRVDEVHELSYGQVADVGPFEVINGGVMRIGDRGACNASPEHFKIGAWRRK